jgi:hypothetical protein
MSTVQQTNSYLFDSLAIRYPVFFANLQTYWLTLLAKIVPTSKIKVLELKHVLFESITLLKVRYCEVHVKKSLNTLRLQIAEIINEVRDSTSDMTTNAIDE